jgi:hypothetical protein
MTIFISTFCNGIYVHIHTRKGLAQTRSSLPAPKWLKSSTIRRTLSSQVSKHSYHQFTTCNDIFPCHPRISLTVRLHADMPVSADEPAGLSKARRPCFVFRRTSLPRCSTATACGRNCAFLSMIGQAGLAADVGMVRMIGQAG